MTKSRGRKGSERIGGERERVRERGRKRRKREGKREND